MYNLVPDGIIEAYQKMSGKNLAKLNKMMIDEGGFQNDE